MSARPDVLPRAAAARRSPLDAWHRQHATGWQIRESMTIPTGFAASVPRGEALQLADFSWRRRFGCKGPAAESWLGTQSFVAVPGANRWCLDARGVLVARLATSEFLVEAQRGTSSAVEAARGRLLAPAQPAGLFPVWRQDLVLQIHGPALGSFLRQVCSFDFTPLLRTGGEREGEVVLTAMIGVAVVAIVRPGSTITVWSDPSFAHYFWTRLLEVAADLGGGVAACNAEADYEERT